MHVGRGIVIVADDFADIIELAKKANLKNIEDRQKSGAKEKANLKAYADLLRTVTRAMWPGLTYWALVTLSSDTSALTMPYNRIRMDLLMGINLEHRIC